MDPTTTMKKRKTEDNNGTAADGVTSLITPIDLRKIIEPFTKDQLLDILQHAAIVHLDVLNSIRAIADRDPSQRKLFIRGLNITTTSQGLHNLFSAYGELLEAVVVQDKETKRSKGFGFINFKHVDGALLALKEPNKIIDGHMTHTQLASAGVPVNANEAAGRKIYVGNVPGEMPAERLLGHFLSYGVIEDGPLGYDKVTGKARGFVLFVYKSSEGAKAALVDPVKIVDGVQLTCKLAWDGKKPPVAQNGGDGAGVQPLPPTSVNVPQYTAPSGSGAGGGGGMPFGGHPSAHQGPVGDAMQTPTQVPNSNVPHYPVPGGGGGGVTPYGGYSSAYQGPAGLAHPVDSHVLPMCGYGVGLSNNPYNALGGGPPLAYRPSMSSPYNGLGGGPPSAHAGLPALSLYRLPPLPSGGYPQGGQYGIPPSAFPGQLPQELTSAAVPRTAPGVVYPSLSPHH